MFPYWYKYKNCLIKIKLRSTWIDRPYNFIWRRNRKKTEWEFFFVWFLLVKTFLLVISRIHFCFGDRTWNETNDEWFNGTKKKERLELYRSMFYFSNYIYYYFFLCCCQKGIAVTKMHNNKKIEEGIISMETKGRQKTFSYVTVFMKTRTLKQMYFIAKTNTDSLLTRIPKIKRYKWVKMQNGYVDWAKQNYQIKQNQKPKKRKQKNTEHMKFTK